MNYRSIIAEYFQSWIDKDSKVMVENFHKGITYTECYGPVYFGIDQCLKWFNDWNQIGSVLKWEIRNIYQDGDIFIVEWYFECEYQNNVDGFDGVSLIKFTDDKIISVKEFQSKREHHYPYGDK